jgi:hypothetical protein
MGHSVTGVAVIFGFSGGTVTYTGAGTFIKETVDLEMMNQVDELTDDDNELLSLVHSKEEWKATLLFTPRAASGTNTLSNAAGSFAGPAKGAAVTLASFAITALNQTDWVYDGSWKITGKKNGIWQAALKIRRSPNNNLATVVS